MAEGFITLERAILTWEWYDNIPTKVLFIHCLLKANHKPNNWRGIDIKRGQFITSIQRLSDETGLTTKQIRTALKNLEKTNELGKQTTSVNTLISVIKYDFYQSVGKPKANEGQSEGKVRATNNNDNNKNNENKNIDPTEKFLKWFNQKIYQHKNVLGKFSSLTKTDLNNLKKLQDAGYTQNDFDHAFNVMYFSEWVKDNNMATPSHYLRNDNFQKYLNTQLDVKNEAVDLDTDLANYVNAHVAKYRSV